MPHVQNIDRCWQFQSCLLSVFMEVHISQTSRALLQVQRLQSSIIHGSFQGSFLGPYPIGLFSCYLSHSATCSLSLYTRVRNPWTRSLSRNVSVSVLILRLKDSDLLAQGYRFLTRLELASSVEPLFDLFAPHFDQVKAPSRCLLLLCSRMGPTTVRK